MSLPGVSILVSTFARTALLAELVECFRRQDYAGPLEMLVVNGCEEQTLSCDTPGVSIYNTAPKPRDHNTPPERDDDLNAEYHHHRNRMVRMAMHELICWWDDDDLYLPDFVRLAVGKLRAGEPCARLSRILAWDGRLAIVSAGHFASVIMRKRAFHTAGGYRPEEGEANAGFWKRALAHGFLSGRHHHEDDGLGVKVVRRVDNTRVRLSRPDGPVSIASARRSLLARIHNGEPAGPVTIVPSWSCDWLQFVQDHSA